MIQPAPHRAWLCAALLAASAAGCGAGAPVLVTPRHVEESGTASFQASADIVFRACLIALQMSGHRIQVAEPATGLVVAWPDAREPPGNKPHHGYLMEVRAAPDGRMTVVATPTLPDEDAIRRGAPPPPWELGRERAAWNRLFTDIRNLVDRTRAGGP